MKKNYFYLVMLVMMMTLGVSFTGCDKDDDGGSGKTVPEWARGEWYALKYPSNPELGLWTTPTAVISSSQISFSGTTLACTSVKGDEVVFGTNSVVRIQKGDNDKQVIMDTDGGKSTLYAAGAY